MHSDYIYVYIHLINDASNLWLRQQLYGNGGEYQIVDQKLS
jgi:hypothetical protein